MSARMGFQIVLGMVIRVVFPAVDGILAAK